MLVGLFFGLPSGKARDRDGSGASLGGQSSVQQSLEQSAKREC